MANLPGWVNDPAEFIKVVHSVSGEGDNEIVRREIATLKADIDKMMPKPEPQTQFVTGVELTPIESPVPTRQEAPVEPEMAVVVPKKAAVVPKEEEFPQVEVYHLLTELASLSQLTQIKEKLAKEEFEGKLDPRKLDATDSLKWLDLIEGLPHRPWITAYFINDGPDSVEIGINHPELLRQEIKENETLKVSQEHADERIRRLFYKCDAGETASVRVVGQY